MANVRQIAQRAGVSISTVSRVLNNHPRVSPEARQRVVAAANKAGYRHVADARATTNIAFVYTGEMFLDSPFDTALLDGISGGMEEHGYDLMVLNTRRSRLPHETYTQMFMRKGIRAAILRATATARPICDAIADEGFPAVVVGDRYESSKVHFVSTNTCDASREAVTHLIGLGHRRIAICLGVVQDSDHVERFDGYRQALAEHGLPFDERLVLWIKAGRQGGVQLVKQLQSMLKPPTAVFITDPLTALGALKEARRLGIGVPGDLSIVGFDDSEVRHDTYPGMTAVCQDARAMGREAFNALYGVLEQGEPIQSKILRGWFEIHESTGPVAARRTDGADAPASN